MAAIDTPNLPATMDRPPLDGSPPGSDRQDDPPVPAHRNHGARWPAHRLRTGQIVTTQVTLAALVATVDLGVPAMAAVIVAGALLTGTWCRIRRRWLHQWLVVGVGYLARRRDAVPDDEAVDLLDLLAPHAVVHTVELGDGPVSLLDDQGGLVALLEIGDPADVIGDGSRPLPSPARLLRSGADQAPPVRIQLLLAGAAAPAVAAGGGTAAVSYRQLTDGGRAGWERAVLAVRVSRVSGWPEEALRHALAGIVRRIVRGLRPVAVRPLGEQSTRRMLAEFAHHDGRGVRESWQAVRCGGLLQTTFRLRRWPTRDCGSELVPRLLALPATAVTVSLHSGTESTRSGGLAVRLAAATPADLSTAARALRQAVAATGAEVQRLDGAQLHGLAGTLPLALPTGQTGTPAGPGDGKRELTLSYGSAGLVLGVNRHGDAVTVRLFRPVTTRVVLIGGVRAAQLVALRAMALGARVIVQTTRPHAWEPFVRGARTPGGAIPLVRPDRPVAGASGTPLAPLLVVLDAAPAGPRPGAAWQTTLLVRDELTPADTEALRRADLAVLQPLSRAEATIAGNALGLGDSADLLTRIRPDMVGVVNRRALRWALLACTPIEEQLIGAPTRDMPG